MSSTYDQYGQRQAGQDEVVSQKILFSTAFYRPGKAVDSVEFFKSSPNKFWNNIKLPVEGNFRYDVNALRVDAAIQFEVGTDATRNALMLKAFYESAYIKIDHVKLKDMYVIPLCELMPFRYVETVDAAGAWSIQRVDKQTDAAWFPLQEILQFGKGVSVEITLVVPPGFTTEGYLIGTTPVCNGAELAADGGTPINASYYVKLYMNSIEGAQS